MEENTEKSANYALLEERIARLNKKNFDWTAWKKGTLLVLEKIFGYDSLYVKELSETDYHYNSWSLRDTAGSEDPVKASVRELLNICLTDVEHRSTEPLAQNQGEKSNLTNLLSQFLDNDTVAEFKKIASSGGPLVMKEEQAKDLINEKLPKHQDVLLGKILLDYFSKR
ncbi:hypothetical protein [Marinilabilia rubra]|uniref:Uncharacterized protein n=1 Tax=Marinilabilia rubra TaxID=2162893 RepID=A0A2U2B7N2_9BACT|nr:hypothetical protein [Marinilabilia rubra]PWD99091.1 hypothetical protein DDZ16_12615 [Marinilabilia rubra]